MDAHPKGSKYAARVDRSDTNTSHAQVLDLVGSDKRVLDVGCASGYLAEALVAQGNKVSGVELDAEAAEKARPHLDRLVVGDVEQLDLVGEFGPGEFDVLIFADVLEHVRNPVDVLHRTRPLLADGGYAVVSIPNVAHGSVRLALMRGRFEYRPLGLLDDTHLRFFTRASFEQLIADAGFVAVDVRQTTAGAFETEIPLRRADYADAIVAEVEADPESRTYQFVARVEPVDGSGSALGDVLAERNREVYALRRLVADIARLAGGGPNHPVVGVLDAGGPELPAVRSLRAEVTRLELRRRLAGFEVRGYTLDPGPAAPGIGFDGVQSLAPWTPATAADLRTVLDSLVVLPGAGEPAERVLADLEEAGLPLHRLGAADPDPLAVVDRLADPELGRQRSGYLKAIGAIPGAGRFALRVGVGGRSPAVEPTGPAVVDVPADVAPLDLIGMVVAADRVESEDPGGLALAGALGRPVAPPGSGPTAAPGPVDAGLTRSRLAGAVDRHLDQLYANLVLDAGSRLAGSVPQRLAELRSRVQLLESVNAGLGASLGRERFAMASEVARLHSAAGGGAGPRSPLLVEQLRHDVNRASAQNARLEDEIARIYATRTMRVAAPLRRLYGRVRRLRP